MARGSGILFGVLTHLFFAWTVYRLFLFLYGAAHGLLADRVGPTLPWYACDALLALQFALIHSWLLHWKTRERIERWWPSAFYGCLFCVATCGGLLLTIELWQPHPVAIWRMTGHSAWLIRTAFIASWIGLFYSLNLTGLGYQTGLAHWVAWLRGQKPPRRVFAPKGAYLLLRHPVYLSFLGLIWFTPVMTLDHAVLTFVWTIYIFVGSHLKDRRLLHFIGDPYREYQSRVPGYPFFFFGPLARVPHIRLPQEVQSLSALPWKKAA
jgi:protein-S-isoprenylcysteine O-methyltransferase Ste14